MHPQEFTPGAQFNPRGTASYNGIMFDLRSRIDIELQEIFFLAQSTTSQCIVKLFWKEGSMEGCGLTPSAWTELATKTLSLVDMEPFSVGPLGLVLQANQRYAFYVNTTSSCGVRFFTDSDGLTANVCEEYDNDGVVSIFAGRKSEAEVPFQAIPVNPPRAFRGRIVYLPVNTATATPTAAAGAATTASANTAATAAGAAASANAVTARDVAAMLAFTPCTRISLSALRSCSRLVRRALEVPAQHHLPPKLQQATFGSAGEMFISRLGECLVYNQRRLEAAELASAICVNSPVMTGGGGGGGGGGASPVFHAAEPTCTDDEGAQGTDGGGSNCCNTSSSFMLHSLNPVGRKFRDSCARIIARNAALGAPTQGLCALHLHHADITAQCFEWLASIPTLLELQLVMCKKVDVLTAVSGITSLRCLHVEQCGLVADGVGQLFLPNLKHLRIKRCPALESIQGIALETAASLVELVVQDCPLVADDGCDAVMPNLRNVENLSLADTAIGCSLMLLPPQGRQKLESLDVSNTACTTEIFDCIAGDLSHLRVLRLEQCEGFLSLEPVQLITSLTALDVSSSDYSHAESIASLHATLRSLRMADSPFLTFVEFVGTLVNLTMLDLARSGVGDSEMVPIGRLRDLEALFITNCTNVTNVNPLRQCTKLKRLFAGGTSLTDDGVAFLSDCVALEELDLSGTEVEWLGHLTTLTRLKVLNVFGGAVHDASLLRVSLGSRVEVLIDARNPDDNPD